METESNRKQRQTDSVRHRPVAETQTAENKRQTAPDKLQTPDRQHAIKDSRQVKIAKRR